MQCHGDQCVRTTLLLHNYVSTISCKEYKKTGLWVVSDDKGCTWLGVSPNGIVDGEIVVEIKCPYMGGNPYPYRKVPITYIPQCQLEIDEQFIQNLLQHLKTFWTDAVEGRPPTLMSGNVQMLKKTAKEITDNSKLLRQISPATADFNPSSSTMDALLEAIILRGCKDNFTNQR
ncbi:unnamed protein product [Porites lobata]|uniref:YqaJ viral recombinase domain-containing protein n=1 Tax=Porites lobata TaxID=104759 RepID=A0ABN8R3M4_9CNID|nr:unnamed protein product [Porites lobata]